MNDHSHRWPDDEKVNEYGLAARKALDPEELDWDDEMQWPVYHEAKGG